jgi:hypothetical protein
MNFMLWATLRAENGALKGSRVQIFLTILHRDLRETYEYPILYVTNCILVFFAPVAPEPRFTTNNKNDCVVREPLQGLAAQLRETAIFEGEPSILPTPPLYDQQRFRKAARASHEVPIEESYGRRASRSELNVRDVACEPIGSGEQNGETARNK